MANGFGFACNFQNSGNFTADADEIFPFLFQSRINVFFFNFRPGHHQYGFRHIGGFLHELPYFFHGKAQYRSQHYNQINHNFIHGSLGAAAFNAVCFVSVQSVFQNIQIVASHFYGAEVMNCMVQHMEIVIFVSLLYFFFQQLHVHKCPAVKLLHLFKRHFVFFVVKVIGIAQNVTDGVADFAVYFGKLFQNIFGDTDISFVIAGSSPQADNICAVLFDNVLRSNGVAYGFGHFAAFAVNNIAVG